MIGVISLIRFVEKNCFAEVYNFVKLLVYSIVIDCVLRWEWLLYFFELID